jgi:hypothetical protein
MNIDRDLVGKTITGVIASPQPHADTMEIWLLQFSDGSHVEFVSPQARRGLRAAARRPPAVRRAQRGESAQLSLSVA